jgi:hypothetical protein
LAAESNGVGVALRALPDQFIEVREHRRPSSHLQESTGDEMQAWRYGCARIWSIAAFAARMASGTGYTRRSESLRHGCFAALGMTG